MKEEVYLLLLKYNRIILENIPEDLHMLVMCILGVYANELNYKFIPKEYFNE